MRILKPEVAQEREEKLLRWVIQKFVETRRPIGSELVAKHALPGISSATIRNIMKKLEEEGYLLQPHTSGGRIPTDKAYRFYVDYLSKVQKIAAQEKIRIEKEYEDASSELDRTMVQTSRMLAALSNSAGFVYTTSIAEQVVKRLDFIPLAPEHILAVLVTESGSVKHLPLRTNYTISPARLRFLSNVINEKLAGLTVVDAQRVLWESMNTGNNEINDVLILAKKVLEEISEAQNNSEIYLEGLGQLLEGITDTDYDDLRQMLRIVEERKSFAAMMEERIKDLQHSGNKISVTIGSEHGLKEFKNLSIISSAYKVGDKTIGMLGIIGPKHMEYTRMISLVNFIGDLLENSMNNWGTLIETEEEE
ncbi:Heat-inducible transcription repressor HrcA [Elusimicrobium minutum Pei191]|uniref:Heat-inducible transcription repressor HrcA n=1 Tax=Elusimicrobium minutum (strain Pei191) TaxID=445932 RepID=B2KAX2_ELUMP|nr:heat-inducible transcriptional repressor HrcA [Elusimicrobium minutum]ACC97668.1 Heat-inducible transcription repressor HrcA [Elusimicrobium minutum Pei191]